MLMCTSTYTRDSNVAIYIVFEIEALHETYLINFLQLVYKYLQWDSDWRCWNTSRCKLMKSETGG